MGLNDKTKQKKDAPFPILVLDDHGGKSKQSSQLYERLHPLSEKHKYRFFLRFSKFSDKGQAVLSGMDKRGVSLHNKLVSDDKSSCVFCDSSITFRDRADYEAFVRTAKELINRNRTVVSFENVAQLVDLFKAVINK